MEQGGRWTDPCSNPSGFAAPHAGASPRNGRTRFGGKGGPTGFPHAVDEIGLPSTDEHSDDDQGGKGADEPDHYGDFFQSFHENLLLQPWSAAARRERLPQLQEPTCTYGAIALKPRPACRKPTRGAGGLIRHLLQTQVPPSYLGDKIRIEFVEIRKLTDIHKAPRPRNDRFRRAGHQGFFPEGKGQVCGNPPL